MKETLKSQIGTSFFVENSAPSPQWPKNYEAFATEDSRTILVYKPMAYDGIYVSLNGGLNFTTLLRRGFSGWELRHEVPFENREDGTLGRLYRAGKTVMINEIEFTQIQPSSFHSRNGD